MATQLIAYDDNVIITTALATIAGKSYQLSAIQSLEIVRIEKNTGCLSATLFLTGAAFVGGASMFMLADYSKAHTLLDISLLSIASATFGLALIIGSILISGDKPDYAIVIAFISGDRLQVRCRSLAYAAWLKQNFEAAMQTK